MKQPRNEHGKSNSERLPGYPRPRPLTLPDEVRAYFAGDEIVCLLCGKGMQRLAPHLRRRHHLSVAAYRARYGLPWGRGLVSEPSRRKGADRLRAQAPRPLPTPKHNPRRQPRQPFEKALSLLALKKAVPPRPRSRAAHERFLARLQAGETTREIAKAPDMPSLAEHYRYRRTHPSYDRRVKRAMLDNPMPGRIRPRI